MLNHQAEDQLTLAPCVARIDERADVLALDQAQQGLQPVFALGNGLQVEIRRHHRQVRKAPLAALDLIFLRAGDLEKVPDGRRKHIFVRLVIVGGFGESSQRLGNIQCDRRLFGNDQGL